MFKTATILFGLCLGSAVLAVVLFDRYLSSVTPEETAYLAFPEPSYFPYIGAANLPQHHSGSNLATSELGYKQNKWLSTFNSIQPLKHSGEAIESLFRFKYGDAMNTKNYRIFFVGGSVAWGSGKPSETYYSYLEKILPSHYPIKVIPAGMGGATSTDEIIISTLAVLPNKPDMVFILDGWNDVGLISALGVRPGEPYNAFYRRNAYEDPLFGIKRWLIANSPLFKRFVVYLTKQDLSDFNRQLRDDLVFRKAYMESIVSVYVENVDRMIRIFKGVGVPVFLSVQPSADWIIHKDGTPATGDAERDKDILERINIKGRGMSYRDPAFIAETYDRVLSEIMKKDWYTESYVDVLRSVEVENFIDPVHFNDTGNASLAKTLSVQIMTHLPRDWTPEDRIK